jgi:hypothetical protein
VRGEQAISGLDYTPLRQGLNEESEHKSNYSLSHSRGNVRSHSSQPKRGRKHPFDGGLSDNHRNVSVTQNHTQNYPLISSPLPLAASQPLQDTVANNISQQPPPPQLLLTTMRKERDAL